MDEFDYEVIWNGATKREGSQTKGELLGSYASIPISELPLSVLSSKIRAKIEHRHIKEANDDE